MNSKVHYRCIDFEMVFGKSFIRNFHKLQTRSLLENLSCQASITLGTVSTFWMLRIHSMVLVVNRVNILLYWLIKLFNTTVYHIFLKFPVYLTLKRPSVTSVLVSSVLVLCIPTKKLVGIHKMSLNKVVNCQVSGVTKMFLGSSSTFEYLL